MEIKAARRADNLLVLTLSLAPHASFSRYLTKVHDSVENPMFE